jgi:SAM-dependent methyltransferase
MSLLLPSEVSIVAVDLNPAMLDHARAVGAAGHVQWRIADAMALPFDDKTFDVVVCQFGAMFFPDKSLAFSEARRVLARRGTFLFSVWDRIEDNEFADIATAAVADLFPTDPPSFLSRTPHGYFDYATIKSDLRRAGFEHPPETVTLPARSRALSAQIPAFAYCQGTPMRNEIEVRDPTQLEKATDLAAEAIAARFGRGEVDGKIQAKIFSVAR